MQAPFSMNAYTINQYLAVLADLYEFNAVKNKWKPLFKKEDKDKKKDKDKDKNEKKGGSYIRILQQSNCFYLIIVTANGKPVLNTPITASLNAQKVSDNFVTFQLDLTKIYGVVFNSIGDTTNFYNAIATGISSLNPGVSVNFQKKSFGVPPFVQNLPPQPVRISNKDFWYAEQNMEKELECPICMEPLSEPLVHNKCGNMFCSACLNQAAMNRLQNCPLCREVIIAGSLSPAPKYITNKLNDLLVVCPNCRSSCARNQIDTHLTQCPISCIRGCGMKVIPKEFENHWRVCLEYECSCSAKMALCPWRGLRKDLPAHEFNCPFIQLRPIIERLQTQMILLTNSSKMLLKGRNVANMDLSGMNFCNLDLTGTNFAGSVFVNTNFYGSNLSGVNFQSANLTGANLSLTNATNCNFKYARLIGTDFQHSNIVGANFEQAFTTNANFFSVIYEVPKVEQPIVPPVAVIPLSDVTQSATFTIQPTSQSQTSTSFVAQVLTPPITTPAQVVTLPVTTTSIPQISSTISPPSSQTTTTSTTPVINNTTSTDVPLPDKF